MIRLSFIIAAYNASATIGATLESILSLKLDDDEYEVIVIDDCSSDGTVSTVESFRSRIRNLIVFRQMKNNRQGAARNVGIAHAKGKFITFVDADDKVLPGMRKTLEKAEETDADMCFSPIEHEQKDNSCIWKLTEDDFCKSSHEVCEMMFEPFCILFLAPCGYLLKRSFLESTGRLFIEGHQFEDTDFTLYCMSASRTISYSSVASYRNIFNAESTTHTKDIQKVIDHLLMSERILDLAAGLKDLPSFTEKLNGQVAGIGLDRLELWYIGKLDPATIKKLYEAIPPGRRLALAALKPGTFQAFILNHRRLATVFLTLWHPIAMAVSKIRSIADFRTKG